MRNPKTLICHLTDGSIRYTLYSGHSSSGMPHSLSNLQCQLPVDKIFPEETKEDFVKRVIDIINKKSVCRVIKEIDCHIVF
jgi:hypothetical protein